MNSAREEFLGRVRQSVSAGNRPGIGGSQESYGRMQFRSVGFDLLQLFQQQLVAVGGFFHLVSDDYDCRKKVLQLVSDKSEKRVLIGGGELIHRLNLENHLKDGGRDVAMVGSLNSDSRDETFFDADIGISEVDYLVADTGTVVVNSSPHQPRSITLLPPIHIAVAERKQLVPDLFDLFPSAQSGSPLALPSCITFITGPSKTGDIELKLVTGVHGPGEIHVILIDR